MARKLVVQIVGDTRSLERSLGRVDSKSKTFGRNLKIGATAALGGLAVAARNGFQELAESQRVTAQTNAALKSTAGVANVTAKQVDKLATSVSGLSGIDDEAVQAGENMLLTFTGIRNEVGKGNDIFNQATTAVADLATRMNNGAVPAAEDMKTASLQLGKALNDPVKGVGQLRRVGIQFTADQVKLIKTLEATGHHLEAQKIILGEVQKEFGGSAKAAGETLPGQLAKARNAFDEMSGQLLVSLIPAMTTFAAIVEKVSGLMQRHQKAAKLVIGALAALAVVVLTTSAAVKAYAAVQVIARATTIAWTAAQWALNVALTANPIGLLVVGLAAFGVALVVAWKKSETFRKVVTGAFHAVKAAVKATIEFVIRAVNRLIDVINAIKLPSVSVDTHIPGVGKIRSPGIDPFPTVGHIPALAAAGGVTVVHTTVELDGKKVATNTTKHQQTRSRRNPPQKRGITRPG